MQKQTPRRTSTWAAFSTALLLVGCGESRPAPSPSDAAVGGETDAAPSGETDAWIAPGASDRCLGAPSCARPKLVPQTEVPLFEDTGDGWLRLIEADWQLEPQSEGYRCVRRTMPEDIYITGFSPMSPNGTHHTVLMVNNAGQPDGVTVCDVNSSGERRLQGAGVGTNPTSLLPDGVAMKIGKGQQLLMNLHLFNPSDKVLQGHSGMRVKLAKKADVKLEAEVRLVGPLTLQIPVGQAVQKGRCTFNSPTTIFSIGPHMHQLGVHAKVTAHGAAFGDKVLHDAAYDFTHQYVYEIDELKLAAGDYIEVECTYHNTTDRIVTWGDSSLTEMCFAGVGMYPSTNSGSFPCTN